LYFPKRISAN